MKKLLFLILFLPVLAMCHNPKSEIPSGKTETIYYSDGSIETRVNDSIVSFTQDTCGNIALGGTTYWNESLPNIDTSLTGYVTKSDAARYIPIDSISSWRVSKPRYVGMWNSLIYDTISINDSIKIWATHMTDAELWNTSIDPSMKVNHIGIGGKNDSPAKKKLHIVGNISFYDTIAEGFTPPDDKLNKPKQVAIWDGNLYTNYNSDTTWVASDIIISEEEYTPSKELKALMDTTRGIAGTLFDDSPIITFQMLLDYEKECYNDSTKVRTHKDRFVGMCYSYGDGCNNPDHYEYIWIHKVVIFAGFIQWYKNK